MGLLNLLRRGCMWILVSCLMPCLLSACAVTPAPIVHQPTSAYGQSAKAQREVNGAIFQASSYRPLFEDYKARLVGDVVTITITENTSATKAAASSATVVEVLPNGNLLVSGEKQIAFNKGAEFVRFSGIVNPHTINAANTVSSTQVADARFEYRSTSRVDLAEANSLLTRFFLSFLPF